MNALSIRERKRLRKKRTSVALSHLLLLAGALVMIFPLIWLISSSFKPGNEIFAKEFTLLPQNPTVENFVKGWKANPQYSFAKFFGNTLFLVGGVTIGNILSCSLTAFALARLDIPFKKLIFSLVMLTLMLPTQVTLISQYLMFSEFNWLSTYKPFIVPAFLSTQSFFVYMLVQHMRGIPKDLDEAARIDGCSNFRIYWNIIMPLSMPAVISVAIFSFVWTWNDFLTQLIYLSEVQKFTVSLLLSSLVDSTSSTNWGSLLALSLLSIIPCVIIYFAAQKHFVEGIATSGLKG